jgi:two-component system OmpR family response regulator
MRILLVEDDRALGGAVQGHLTLAGHAVDLVRSLDEARAALATADHGLLLLDLGLPDGSGLDLLRRMRAQEDWRPVIVLTARDQISDRIAGLKAGADDYLVKPFDLDELAARVQAVARRGRASPGQDFHAGGVTLHLADRRALLDDVPVLLTGREWAILDRLLRRPGAVVSREQIEQALYAFGEEAESNAVEVRISRIRKKLGAALIETLRGIGYRVRAG